MQNHEKQFLADIAAADAETRFRSWRRAGEMSVAVVPELGRLAASPEPGVAKAAREALTTLTHSVGKEPGAKRGEVVKEMLALAGGGAPLVVKVHALRLLSLIAGEDSVPAIGKWLGGPDLAEEAAYCLERIPGPAADKAFIAAYRGAKDAFKPRLLAALGHRQSAEGLALVMAAMRSPDKEIAVAAAKAFGRIGKKPAAPAAWPPTAGLSEWQQIDRMDSQLRWADAQAKTGNAAGAMAVYKAALARSEPHWQCAGAIGLGRLGTAEAAAALLPLLDSKDGQVRRTAAQAWKRMADRPV